MKHLAAALFLVLSSAFSFASDPVDARYVRVTLKGKNRVLTLAEVEVFVDGKNVARSGKASQSSVASDGTLSRPIIIATPSLSR